MGSSTSLPNDDTPGVDLDDFARWRAQYGHTMGGTGASLGEMAGSEVPEASSLALLTIASIACGVFRRLRVQTK